MKFALAALLLLGLINPISAEEKPRLILLTVKGAGIDRDVKSNIRVAIEQELSARYTVFSGSQVDKKIEREFVTQCRIYQDDAEMANSECMKVVAGFFVAEYLAIPHISLQEGGYLLTLEIRDAYTSQSVDPYSGSCVGCSVLQLADSFRAMIAAKNSAADDDGDGTPEFVTVIDGGDGSSGVSEVDPPPKLPAQQGQLALLLFDSVPSGAEVWLGDIKAGTTPYQNLQLKPGQKLNLTLKAQDYRDLQVELTLQPGSNTPKAFQLVPAFGSLSITSEPSGADVYLSGELVGQTPYSNQRLASAKYLVDIRKPLYLPLSNQTIAVEDGKLSEHSFKLRPNFGDLSVASEPSAATITLEANGREVFRGSTPIALQLEPATYILSASKSGYAQRRFEVKIARGQRTSISKEQLQLRRLSGTAVISSEPASPGARVLIDGKDAGAVPLITELPVGSYEITIKGDKLQGSAQLQIRDGEQRTLVVELAQGGSAGDVIQDCPQCPQMVYIPAGSFRMGDIQGGGDSDEKPVHRVSVSAFLLGQTEVTVGQFRAFVDASGYKTEAEQGDGCYVYENGSWDWRSGKNWRNPGFKQSAEEPVVCVSWNDAQRYIEWLSKKTSSQYRLPTEAEWEYAARAGSETKYFFGNSTSDLCRYANGAANETDFSWRNKDCRDGYKRTAPTASFTANAFGLYDMHGNVWEWTQDCLNSSYQGAPSDGTAWLSGNCSRRVLRGGSWSINPNYLRSANRINNSTGNRYDNLGFRLARTLD